MSYQINFGRLTTAKSVSPAQKTRSFRIAVLGDFSARANRGELEAGKAIAARKPLKVDCDNVDDMIARLHPRVALPFGDGALEIEIATLDDLHPDQLYANLPIFSELAGLRKRLQTKSTFAKAAQEVQTWAGEVAAPPSEVLSPARGSTIPSEGQLSDFARLVGQPTAESGGETAVDVLLKNLVAPHVVPSKDPRQDLLVAALDKAVAAMMREVLHHPDFQTLEGLWRSVDFLVRRLESDAHLQIVLLDISAEELAADLSRDDDLANSGIYQLLVEQPAQDAHQGPYSLIVGNYIFDRTPAQAELLGRVARIAARAQAPFIASMTATCVDVKVDDIEPQIQEAWAALRAMPESDYVALTVPQFMLRQPYGAKTEPIDSFDFEEFTPETGLGGMLWGNSAILAGFLLGANFSRDGAKMTSRGILSVGELPFYFQTDQDGDQVALPCTELLLTSRTASELQAQGFMPVLAIKGSPEIRLGGFNSIAGTVLAGWWAPPTPRAVPPQAPPPAQEEAPAAPPPAADSNASPPPPAEPVPENAAAGLEGLDSLLADLASAAPPAESPTPPSPTADAAPDDGLGGLDALLADLTAATPPAENPNPPPPATDSAS